MALVLFYSIFFIRPPIRTNQKSFSSVWKIGVKLEICISSTSVVEALLELYQYNEIGQGDGDHAGQG